MFEPATAEDWTHTPDLYKNINPLTSAAAHYYLKVSAATGTSTTYPIVFTNRVLSLKNTQSKVATLATQKGIAFQSPFYFRRTVFHRVRTCSG